ncbi:MAG: UDP-2,3-diacylglucosamine diphosphatase [gamma proteobacterium symbiont of Bathyaustriella thionipta]|nr:UDP-2,3-diacylglucosamine diphosphatase [gamma proteobacterium symbiont of Bathyaustriella thionipta]MCU7949622.1 UDP-2,3-diacylglucosamine diphosphatase [gamma proteobacterium symbiont of Bathyaustriella thionipta]MCU7954750.1 UDP-2,3-diacylglucosamine diphosphatase [gamma proteobacterium symbiont of Bathyaustriella thionipta]MCU7958124.1 UDP-2,3-diacylglucosamine diphosphatase [gamma proteobacterium symbiont of Bathyaustriella thionipta]MCU7967916.1 UDP-2,3-diacylglucosamine diphosphatase 
MKTLFISDLHLDPKRTDIQASFDRFINTCLTLNQNSRADSNHSAIAALYILGDLFEVWIGDDASIPVYKRPIAQLKQLSESGTQIYVMHGNRDFLMGSGFEQASGCKLIPDLYQITIASQKILLSHGDIFCTDDKDYLSFRQMVRAPLWQQEFLAKSIAERVSIAQTMREQSKKNGLEKASEITDVNQDTVEQIMLEYNVSTLIHGHTHRPVIHNFKLHKNPVKRIVLPDWTPDAKPFEIETSA